MNLIAIRNWLLLANLVNLLCPCLKQSNWKLVIGCIIRVVHVSAIILMNNSSWEYDCNLTYGCSQYITMMIAFQPYKSLIQHFCTLIVDGINYLCQDSEMDKLRKQIESLENQMEHKLLKQIESQQRQIEALMPPPDIYLNVDDWLTDEPNQWDSILCNHDHAD
jgi:hypothetical protein